MSWRRVTHSNNLHWSYWQQNTMPFYKWVDLMMGFMRVGFRMEPSMPGTRPDTGSAGYYDASANQIIVNPLFYFSQPEIYRFEGQGVNYDMHMLNDYRAVQGEVMRLVGNVFWTRLPKEIFMELETKEALAFLTKVMEDQRVEYGMLHHYPGMKQAIWKNKDVIFGALYNHWTHINSEDDLKKILAMCLYWRFASDYNTKESLMQEKFAFSDPTMWAVWNDKVRPLVEQAWIAPSTTDVVEIAREILELLDMPEDESMPEHMNDAAGQPQRGASPEFANGEGEGEGQPGQGPPQFGGSNESRDQEGEGEGEGQGNEGNPDDKSHMGLMKDNIHGHGESAGDGYSMPAPYQDLLRSVETAAKELAGKMAIDPPKTRAAFHDYKGKADRRKVALGSDKPHRKKTYKSRKPGVVFDILVDRSGSMGIIAEEVREALMTLYHATKLAKVPTGLAVFGGGSGHDPDSDNNKERFSEISSARNELAYSLIAGYDGNTGAEYLRWSLDQSYERLRVRKERTKICVVIHDGQPVHGGGKDYRLSIEKLELMRRKGVKTIGIYLGNNRDDIEKMGKMFPDLIVTDQDGLVRELSSMFRRYVRG